MGKITGKTSLLAVLSLGGLLLSCAPTASVGSSPSSAPSSTTDSTSDSSSSTGYENGADTHAETAPLDYNVYFYSASPYANRDWIWAWNDTASFGLQTAAAQVVLPEIGADFPLTPLYLEFGKAYHAYSDWGFGSDSLLTATDAAVFTGIIFRSKTGSSQTSDFTIDPSRIVADGNGNYSVFLYEGKGVFYTAADFPTAPVDSATYSEGTGTPVAPRLSVSGNGLGEVFADYTSDHVRIRPYVFVANVKTYGADVAVSDTGSTVGQSGTLASLLLTQPLDIGQKYEIWVKDKAGVMGAAAEVSFLSYYESAAFNAKYVTDKTLGAAIEDGQTAFRLWSPTASAVTVNVYAQQDAAAPSESRALTKDENGVFETTVASNLNGQYYDFDVTNFGQTTANVPDPYALSSNANGRRSMVVDWDQVAEPTGFDQPFVPQYANHAGIAIMEMQTRDFTSSAHWDGPAADRGKYRGLHDTGTALPNGTKTGFDYVKELKAAGLTHVQLQPAYDFQSVDETRLDDPAYQALPVNGIYNWGYDPQQYNAPEGSFSSDPADGTTRVDEFRDFVNDYNQAGIGVVMDVVYNHMPSQTGSSFDKVFPGYYFRAKSYSGAGVDIASQRAMVRKFIVDSAKGWVEHYHVSGFRFDLMGLVDLETMRQVRVAMDAIDPDILVYGEGWSMFGGDPTSTLTADGVAQQNRLYTLGEDWVGSFNDSFRDGMKGSVFNAGEKGFVQYAIAGDDTANSFKNRVYDGLIGTYGTEAAYVPGATDGIGASLAYVEAHDNLTLWDKLSVSSADPATVATAAALSNATVLSSLSPAFFEIGQDFGRSKKLPDDTYKVAGKYVEDPNQANVFYSSDSYNLGDAVNNVDWSLLQTNAAMATAFRGALTARKQVAAGFGADLPFAAFQPAAGRYAKNLIDDPYVISYAVSLGAASYVAIQNYTARPVTYQSVTVPAYGSYAGLI